MALLTENLSYQNTNKWMEKLSEIPWGKKYQIINASNISSNIKIVLLGWPGKKLQYTYKMW